MNRGKMVQPVMITHCWSHSPLVCQRVQWPSAARDCDCCDGVSQCDAHDHLLARRRRLPDRARVWSRAPPTSRQLHDMQVNMPQGLAGTQETDLFCKVLLVQLDQRAWCSGGPSDVITVNYLFRFNSMHACRFSCTFISPCTVRTLRM